MTKFYLINLDDSELRLKQSAERLGEQGISFARVSGIKGTALSYDDLCKHYDPELNNHQYYYPLSKSQIGCYLSHRKAWRLIAEGDAEFGIVLEDDFILTGDLNKALETLEGLPFSWDLIKLSAYANRERDVKLRYTVKNEFDLVIHDKPMSGGAATAISKHAAKRLLQTTAKFGRPCDTDLQYFWERSIHIMSLLPYPVAQDLRYDSTISTHGNKKQKRPFKRLLQQAHAFFKNKKAVTEQIEAFKQTINKHS